MAKTMTEELEGAVSLPVDCWHLIYTSIAQEIPAIAESILDTFAYRFEDFAKAYENECCHTIVLMMSGWHKILRILRANPDPSVKQLGGDITFQILE